MDLSPQNKNFLDVLHKLGIDVKDFPDKTFDGLFENVPDNLNYFFNWFMENISSSNALTPAERATYFQLENSELVPTQEEMDCIFATYNPPYEELYSLDPNYVKILLPRDLVDLNRNSGKLNEIYTEIESNCLNLKERQKNAKEESNSLKKQLTAIKQECDNVNVLFNNELDEVKETLLKEPEIKINFDLYRSCLEIEDFVFDQIQDFKIFKDDLFQPSKFNLSELKDDLTYVKTSLILSQGFLKAKKKEIEVLSKVLSKKSLQESFNETKMQSQLINHEDMYKIKNDIKLLESKLYEILNKRGQNKIDKIVHEYFHEKTGLCKSDQISQLNKCKNYMLYRNRLDDVLLQILKRAIKNLENESSARKKIYLKLQEHERNFCNSTSNLELQSKRFKEVSLQQQQQPLLQAVKDVINTDKNFAKCDESLNNIMETVSYENIDADYILQNLKNKLQSSVKDFFDNTLCGPTNEVLFTPVELSIKFQECVEYEKKLSHSVRQLASMYMEAKDSISKSDRQNLLLWIKFLTQSLLPVQTFKYMEE